MIKNGENGIGEKTAYSVGIEYSSNLLIHRITLSFNFIMDTWII